MAHTPTRRLGLPPGTQGSPITVITNSFAVSKMPNQSFVHYDEFPDFSRPLSRDRALQIIDRLQIQEAQSFNPRAAFDGKRNMFRSVPINLPSNRGTFQVYFGEKPVAGRGEVKSGVKVTITRVAEINPGSLLNVLNGRNGHTSESLTSLTLLNILIRMKPIMTYPSNARSFFTQDKKEMLGGGLEAWRGLFQSVRPTIDRLLINIDVATAIMYSGGSLLNLMLEFLNLRDIRQLTPRHVKRDSQARLDSFLKRLLVCPTVPARPGQPPRYRKIVKVVMKGANDYVFDNDISGEHLTITEHFYKAHHYRVRFGDAICVDVGRDVVYPLEVLNVKEGQLFKKVLPSAIAPRALKFATQRPSDRIRAIERGTELLDYANSDYLRHSGLVIDERLICIKARVLPPPPIQWGGSQRPDIPRGGAWNVLGKRLYRPEVVKAWAVVLFDPRLNSEKIMNFLKMFVDACSALGMRFPNRAPQVINGRPGVDDQGYREDMKRAANTAVESFGDQFRPDDSKRPTFILVILPDSAIDIRIAVKNWGDCIHGCPTQCMKSGKLVTANNQYCNNLALKLNAKIGGVNSVPSGSVETMKWLSSAPTMVIGADVSHAAPGSDRPSIAGMVSSVDENFSQYVASTRLQEPRTEIVAELGDMVEYAIRIFYKFWKTVRNREVLPHRIIFYRDGVSEGQFEAVGKQEVQQIKTCLEELWKRRELAGSPPKLTFIIVAKRHHIRFFPRDSRDADKSGNCPPGLVVDQEVVSPTDYDFYLQSHGGLLGTSRPSHYTVIEDNNNAGADMLQAVSYTLCHVYARATRSVSIPAPVYYADIVCARGKFHSHLIHEGGDSGMSDSSGGKFTLKEHQEAYKDVADTMKTSMYFM